MSDSTNEMNQTGSHVLLTREGGTPVAGSATGEAGLLVGDRALDLRSQQKLISARGTEEGLVLRIDGRAEWSNIVDELVAFLGERRKFLEGGEIAIEWLDRLPTKEQSSELELLLRDRYGIEIIGRKRRPKLSATKTVDRTEAGREKGADALAEVERRAAQEAIPLFSLEDEAPASMEQSRDRGRTEGRSTGDLSGGSFLAKGSKSQRITRGAGIAEGDPLADPGYLGTRFVETGGSASSGGIKRSERNQLKQMTEMLGEDVFTDEEANARVVYGTLRSGQRVETPFSLVVVGDVNPGADLIAGGDIIVFGVLRGTAHAGAYDDDAEGKVIVALQMQPMQLRIGSVISRGGDEVGRGAEVARIEDRRIIVESFNAKALISRRLRS